MVENQNVQMVYLPKTEPVSQEIVDNLRTLFNVGTELSFYDDSGVYARKRVTDTALEDI